ncbi:MAG: hypothetical protein KC766_17125 [Myxococcales bacterium]|nr:hypothetical protein [Myxococcales bacterium]
MLLIGSRAIVIHFPEFRPPQDWDLIGTEAEIAQLVERLPLVSMKSGGAKYVFRYRNVYVEVANASRSEYWARVQRQFSTQPLLEEPVLGEMRLAPAAYLLLTKQCGLVYDIVHWHKNLADLYFLRDRIGSIPEEIAELLPLALGDSERMFLPGHSRRAKRRACGPGARLRWPTLHSDLHALVRIGDKALAETSEAWEAFPALRGRDRQRAMERLLAEEAMVLAAEDYRERAAPTDFEREQEFVIGAMRRLATGGLPIGWRYFCVNHFREILALIPEGFLARLGDLVDGRKAFPHGVEVGERCETPHDAQLHPPATGALRLPHVVGGAGCSERRMESAGACSPLPD